MDWRHDAEESMRGELLEILVLSLLLERDKYGIELRQELCDRTESIYDIQQGTLYGALHRMEEKGMISSYKVKEGTSRLRIYYHLEDFGKKYLKYFKRYFLKVFSGVMQLFEWEEDNE